LSPGCGFLADPGARRLIEGYAVEARVRTLNEFNPYREGSLREDWKAAPGDLGVIYTRSADALAEGVVI
jgi:hypothetical protein